AEGDDAIARRRNRQTRQPHRITTHVAHHPYDHVRLAVLLDDAPDRQPAERAAERALHRGRGDAEPEQIVSAGAGPRPPPGAGAPSGPGDGAPAGRPAPPPP